MEKKEEKLKKIARAYKKVMEKEDVKIRKTGWLDIDGKFEVVGEGGKEATIYAISKLKELKVGYFELKENIEILENEVKSMKRIVEQYKNSSLTYPYGIGVVCSNVKEIIDNIEWFLKEI